MRQPLRRIRGRTGLLGLPGGSCALLWGRGWQSACRLGVGEQFTVTCITSGSARATCTGHPSPVPIPCLLRVVGEAGRVVILTVLGVQVPRLPHETRGLCCKEALRLLGLVRAIVLESVLWRVNVRGRVR